MRLTSVQEKGLKEKFDYLREQYPHILINPTELFIFNKQDANGKIMQCPAGENFAYIDFFADLYPCTHLPSYRMGNLLEQRSLCELWQDSDAAFQLRSLKNKALTEVSGCSGCSNREKCEGGCRGDALFYEGNPLGRPSRCPNQLGILG
jgi:radical SAM protein with 4Fe4S-binding SPASM domain